MPPRVNAQKNAKPLPNFLMRTTIPFLLGFYAASAIAVGQGVVRYDLGKNDHHVFGIETEIRQHASIGEKDLETYTISSVVLSLRVKEVLMGKITAHMMVDSVRVKMKTGGVEGEVPSMDTTLMQVSNGAARTVTILPTGEVLNISNISAAERPLSVAFSPISIVYPTTPLSVGSSWARTIHDSVPMDNVGMVHYTYMRRYAVQRLLDTLGARCAILSLKGSSATASWNGTVSGLDVIIDGDETSDGFAIVELASGLPVVLDMSTSATLRMAFAGMANMIVPLSMERREVIRRRK